MGTCIGVFLYLSSHGNVSVSISYVCPHIYMDICILYACSSMYTYVSLGLYVRACEKQNCCIVVLGSHSLRTNTSFASCQLCDISQFFFNLSGAQSLICKVRIVVALPSRVVEKIM